MKRSYTNKQARAGIDARLPVVECWDNHFKNYTIRTVIPEFTSICPRTGLPDFGQIIIEYCPHRKCIELKSLKAYILTYRNLGIFYENAVNRICGDLVKACRPVWMTVHGDFNARGGLKTSVNVSYRKK